MKTYIAICLTLCFIFISVTALAADWGFSGSRPITNADHLPHPQKSMYYLEQWSSTIYFGKNHNLNIGLIHSMLTTNSKKAVFRVEYNTPDGKTIEDSERCTLKVKREPFMLVCGKGIIRGPLDKLKIQFTGDKLPIIADLKPLAGPFRPGTGRLQSAEDPKDFYDFMLMLPRASATVKVGDKLLRGNGTMDHSYANVGLHKISRHMFRATYIDKDISLIFGANQLEDGRTTGWVSVTDATGRSYSSEKVAFTFTDIWQDEKKTGYFAPKTMEIKSTSGPAFQFSLKNMVFVDRKDMLDHLGWFESNIVRQFSDPMRYNMTGTARIQWTVGAEAIVSTVPDVVVSTKQLNK